MKTQMQSLLMPIMFLNLAVGLRAHAVNPPPDGGYPGGNTAEGTNALLSQTTGGFNAAIGWLSLRGLTTGSFNTGVGAGTLALNNADSNTAIGTAALLFNTAGEGNTATGAFALFSNTQGDFNTANGEFALYSNNTGERNTAIGDSALYSNTNGGRNTAVGNAALVFNTAGSENTAVGAAALQLNNAGNNTAVGADALSDNTMGHHNTAIGDNALSTNTTGSTNTAIGFSALGDSVSGMGNTAIGSLAGAENTSGNFNTYLGLGGHTVNGENDTIRIGDPGFGVACFIGGIWNVSGGSQAVYVNSEGKLGAQVSSRRFKDDIQPMEEASEVIYGLKPVSFRYKREIEPSRPPSFGLIAEDVEAVHPALVVRDNEGKPYTVRYDQVNAMLLNEFLKEHRKNEEQEAKIARQQKEIEKLAALVQKVSAQLEVSRSAPQTALNIQ